MAKRRLKLLLVDLDPIFRLGLQTALRDDRQMELAEWATSPESALRLLSGPAARWEQAVVLVDWQIEVRLGPATELAFCARLRDRFPTLPIVLLGAVPPAAVARARALGVAAIQPKDSPLPQLVRAIERAAAANLLPSSSPPLSRLDVGLPLPTLPTFTPSPPAPVIAPPPLTARQRAFVGNLDELERAIAGLERHLAAANLGWLERTVLAGQRRELRAARALIRQLAGWPPGRDPRLDVASAPPLPDRPPLPTPAPSPRSAIPAAIASPLAQAASPPASPPASPSTLAASPQPAVPTRWSPSPPAQPLPTPSQLAAARAAAFAQAASCLSAVTANASGSPLEIDILRPACREALLGIALRQIQELSDRLGDRRLDRPDRREMRATEPSWQRQIWEGAIEDFYGGLPRLLLPGGTVQVAALVRQDWAAVEQPILGKAVDCCDLLAYWLWGEALMTEGIAEPFGSAAADDRAAALLQNWVVRLACAVVQPLLNRLSDNEAVKHTFFDRRWLSARAIERFRNDLSWAARLDRWVQTPQATFESRHWLLVCQGAVIAKQAIYAPRNEELRSLSGLPLAVTLVLEARDAIGPRLRSVVQVLGRGLIFALGIVGRGLGELGRGLWQGLGEVGRSGSPRSR